MEGYYYYGDWRECVPYTLKDWISYDVYSQYEMGKKNEELYSFGLKRLTVF
jgi:hypothetical protein